MKTVIGFFILAGLVLRSLYFDTTHFSYDQARDAFQALDIIKNWNLKILGPGTDIGGLFHGPLYWYLLSPVYFLFGGSPDAAKIFLIFINLLNIPFIYFFAQTLYKDKRISLFSAFLFAVSFESVQYGRWMSNPAPAVLSIALFFYGFWLVLRKKTLGLPLMILGWILSVHFQFFLVYQIFFLAYGFFLIIRHSGINFLQQLKKYIILYAGGFFLLSPFLIAEIKFKFQGIKALFGYITHSKSSGQPFFSYIEKFYSTLAVNIANNITAGNIVLGKIIVLAIFCWAIYVFFRQYTFKKQVLFLFIWLVSPFIIFPFEKNSAYFLTIGMGYPIILLTALGLYEVAKIFKKNPSIILFLSGIILMVINTAHIVKENKKGDVLFGIQHRLFLGDEKKVVDYVYAEGGGQFAVNTITNPLFINTTWAYLFDWYGKSKYGYMPAWLGYPLDDAGKDVKFSNLEKKEGKTLFLIIEPGPGIPDEYIKGYKRFEDMRSDMVEEKHIGNFIVEKRILKSEKHFSREEVFQFAIQR